MKKFVFHNNKWHIQDAFAFTNKISSLLHAGIPVIESMVIVANQFKGSKKKQLKMINERMQAGKSLTEAFKIASFPYPFFPMLGIAQTHGKLADTFTKLSNWFERKTTFRKTMLRKLMYPTFLLVFVIVITFYFLLFLLPQFQTLLQDFEQELPYSTLLLLNIQSFFQENIFILLMSFCIFLLIGSIIIVILYRRKILYKRFVQIPILRTLIQVRFTYFFTSQLGLLLQSGMGIWNALKEIQANSMDMQFSSYITEIEQHVLRGKPISSIQLSAPMLHHEYFLLTSLGEQLGTLGEQLLICSNLMEKKIEEQVHFFIKWTEPILLLLLGVIIAFVILSLFLPILQLIQSI